MSAALVLLEEEVDAVLVALAHTECGRGEREAVHDADLNLKSLGEDGTVDSAAPVVGMHDSLLVLAVGHAERGFIPLDGVSGDDVRDGLSELMHCSGGGFNAVEKIVDAVEEAGVIWGNAFTDEGAACR